MNIKKSMSNLGSLTTGYLNKGIKAMFTISIFNPLTALVPLSISCEYTWNVISLQWVA